MTGRIWNTVCVSLLFWVFFFTYKSVVVPMYDYYGMGWRDTPTVYVLAVFAMNASIAFLSPPTYARPSQVLFAVQFLVTFLPASIVCLNTSLPEVPQDDIFEMVTAMFAGLLMHSLLHARPKLQSRMGFVAPHTLVRVLLWSTVLFLPLAVFQLRDVFSISALDAIYDRRQLLDDQEMGSLLRYGIVWSVMLVLPLLMVLALRMEGAKRSLGVTACAVGYVLLYGVTATKTTLLAPVIIIGMYSLLKPRRLPYLSVFALFLAGLLAVPAVLTPIAALELPVALYVSIINFRMFSVPHILYVQYLDFFERNQLTYGSHISLINQFISYPYGDAVYMLIGEEYYPGSGMTANAGMWAQDGIAGFGVVGIIMVSGLFTLLMMVLDRAARGHDERVVGASLAMIALFISNASLFTTLVTGGLLWAIVLLRITRRLPTPPGGTSTPGI